MNSNLAGLTEKKKDEQIPIPTPQAFNSVKLKLMKLSLDGKASKPSFLSYKP